MSAPHRIDVHAHDLAPVYVAALRSAERWLIGGIPVPEWTPDRALARMDRFGIARQYLSVAAGAPPTTDGRARDLPLSPEKG